MNAVNMRRGRGRTAGGDAGSTRERIVDAALALFNERGVREVTTNHIAERLGISPGNLYYHFRHREEIVRAILPRVVATVEAAITLPHDRPITPEELASYYLAGSKNLWDYRFLFGDVPFLVGRDPEFAREYRALHVWLLETFGRLFAALRRDGLMDATLDAADLARLGVNAYVVWFSWLSYVRSVRADGTVDRAVTAAGALQSFLVLAPYLEPRFGAAARRALETGAGMSAPPRGRRRGALTRPPGQGR